MDFDGIETHPIFLKTFTDFDGIDQSKHLSNQDLFKQKHMSLKIGDQKVTWDKNFDHVNGIYLTKFSLSKFSVKNFDQIFYGKL